MNKLLVRNKHLKIVANRLAQPLLEDSDILNLLIQRQNEFATLLTQGQTVYNILGHKFKANILSEACFCILTANFKADKSILMQKELAENACFNFNLNKIEVVLKKYGHRFAKQRAQRIVELQHNIDFLESIQKQVQALNQEFDNVYNILVDFMSDNLQAGDANIYKLLDNLGKSRNLREKLKNHINGYGLKEASHFLRNIGLKNIAIIDRHIFRFLSSHKLLPNAKSISKHVYLTAEVAVVNLALYMQNIIVKQIQKYPSIKSQKFVLTPALLDLLLFYNQTGNILK